MNKVALSFSLLLLSSSVAFAQDAQVTSQLPSDSEFETQRIKVIEDQNRLFTMAIMRDRAVAEATAAWWGEVWKALVEAKTGAVVGAK